MKNLKTLITLLALIIVIGACTSFVCPAYAVADPVTFPVLAFMTAFSVIPPLTFPEYINQEYVILEEPKKSLTVNIKRSDCERILPDLRGLLIILKFPLLSGSYQRIYFKKPNDQTLYLLDAQGNPKSKSVFKLID